MTDKTQAGFAPSTQARIWETVAAFIDRHRGRYSFASVEVPSSARSGCGCLWGHAARVINSQRRKKCTRLTNLFHTAREMLGPSGGTGDLYRAMDRILGNHSEWRGNAVEAAHGLRAIAHNLRTTGKMR